MLKFIRTTHDAHGRARQFPEAAWRFWQENGEVVGRLLRPEVALAFDEILVAAEEYAFEYITDGPQPSADEQYLAWCLLRLVEFGMAAVIVVPPTPPELEPQQPLQYTIPSRVTFLH